MSTTKTPQAMYEELVAAIVKVVPEIRQTRYIEGCQAGKQNCGKKGEDGEYLCTWCRQWNGEDRNEDVFRPITLEDVLRALKEAKREWIYAVDCYGNLLEYNREEGWEVEVHEHKLFKWHLGHDLSWHRDNAPEAISFLHFLLSP